VTIGDWVSTLATLALAVAAFWAIWQARGQTEAVHTAAEQDRTDRLASERRQFEIERVLRVVEHFELYVQEAPQGTEGPDSEHAALIRANLSALPLRYLPMFRHAYDVMPDERDGQLHKSQRRPDRLMWAQAGMFREDYMTLLYRLTGGGTNQDYEPIGSPTANRPRVGPGANQP
jgi:hypothetical protein